MFLKILFTVSSFRGW